MFGLFIGQFPMWFIMILGSACIWLLAFLKNKSKPLAGMVNGVFVSVVLLVFFLGLRYGTNIDDFCVNNGHVLSATYEEEWTEEYYTTESIRDSKGNVTGTVTVRHERTHSPEFKADTTVGDESTSYGQYFAMAKRFGTQRLVSSHHPDQCSHGDGRVYTAGWPGTTATMVPWSTKVSVINWVKASKGTVEKRMGAAGFQVPAYPSLSEGSYGPHQPKVLIQQRTGPGQVPPGMAPGQWTQLMDWDMNVLADKVGASKQANPIIVITDQDIGFVEALRASWCNGKKNDIILVVGTKQWPTVEWSDVICWDNNAVMAPTIKMGMQGADLDDRAMVLKVFGDSILKHFHRKRMHDFEYLKNGIEVPGWIYLVSLLAMAGAIAMLLLYDPDRRFRPYSSHFRRW